MLASLSPISSKSARGSRLPSSRQAHAHGLLERHVAHALVRAPLGSHLELDIAPGCILGGYGHAHAHEVAKRLALAEEGVLLDLSARDLDVGEGRAGLR